MNDLVSRQIPELPALSRELRDIVSSDPISRYGEGKDGFVVQRAQLVSRDAAREAARVLPAFEAAFAVQPSRDMVREWLFPVNRSVRNPLAREDFDAKVSAIRAACDDFPAMVFTTGTQREGLVEWQFFPSAADVVKLLEPHVATVRGKLARLRKAAQKAQAAEAQAPVTTPEDRAAVAAHIARVAAETKAWLRARAQEARTNELTLKAEPRYVPTKGLRDAYLAQGLRDPRETP